MRCGRALCIVIDFDILSNALGCELLSREVARSWHSFFSEAVSS